jgi:xanthine dehydrogenase accessory factor
MSDQLPVIAAAAGELADGRSTKMAIIVERSGSVPRGVGAMLLLPQDGKVCGSIGGGVLEHEVVRLLALQQDGQGQLRHFTLTPEHDGMPCGGRITLLLTSLLPESVTVFREVLSLLEQGATVPLFVQLNGDGTAHWGLRPFGTTAPTQEFCIQLEPSPRLLICGAGHIAQSLAPMALATGFQVTVLDDRNEYFAEHPFPEPVEVRSVMQFADCLSDTGISANSYLLIATYGHQHDRAVLEQALRTDARYIGMVGSRRKREELFACLRAAGATDAALSRVRCPVGLPIGAETPAEIAVSILAEMIAVRRGKG